jgi:hypothetical protein
MVCTVTYRILYTVMLCTYSMNSMVQNVVHINAVQNYDMYSLVQNIVHGNAVQSYSTYSNIQNVVHSNAVQSYGMYSKLRILLINIAVHSNGNSRLCFTLWVCLHPRFDTYFRLDFMKFACCSTVCQHNSQILCLVSPRFFLPQPFQFTFRPSSYHSMLYFGIYQNLI